MPDFDFVAIDTSGGEQAGTVDARNRDEALAIIRDNDLKPKTINGKAVNGKASKPARSKSKKEKTSGKSSGKADAGDSASKSSPKKKKNVKEVKARKGGKVKPKDLMVFTRQLATLIDAGLPLVRGMEVLQKQEKNPTMKYAIGGMVDSIKSGSNFADSLAQHPKLFDKLFVNMVKAGEIGGVLDKVLNSLAEFLEKIEKIKGKVISALVYPAVVMSLAIVILLFLSIFIIPKFKEIFADVLGPDVPLPFVTQIVMAVSDFLRSWQKMLMLVIFIILAIFGLKFAAKTPKGALVLDKIKLKLPLFGSLLLKSGISRMTRTLGTLMESGVPVLQALIIVRDTAGNEVLSSAINTVHDSVKEGESMAPPIDSTGIFPPMVVSMVEVGEETGELPSMLHRIADNYEEEVDNAVGALTSIIEPIMIVALAFVVGTIVIALFLPLIKLVTSMG